MRSCAPVDQLLCLKGEVGGAGEIPFAAPTRLIRTSPRRISPYRSFCSLELRGPTIK